MANNTKVVTLHSSDDAETQRNALQTAMDDGFVVVLGQVPCAARGENSELTLSVKPDISVVHVILSKPTATVQIRTID